jgi:hypothetical protein
MLAHLFFVYFAVWLVSFLFVLVLSLVGRADIRRPVVEDRCVGSGWAPPAARLAHAGLPEALVNTSRRFVLVAG